MNSVRVEVHTRQGTQDKVKVLVPLHSKDKKALIEQTLHVAAVQIVCVQEAFYPLPASLLVHCKETHFVRAKWI